jgi:hypothetical protein
LAAIGGTAGAPQRDQPGALREHRRTVGGPADAERPRVAPGVVQTSAKITRRGQVTCRNWRSDDLRHERCAAASWYLWPRLQQTKQRMRAHNPDAPGSTKSYGAYAGAVQRSDHDGSVHRTQPHRQHNSSTGLTDRPRADTRALPTLSCRLRSISSRDPRGCGPSAIGSTQNHAGPLSPDRPMRSGLRTRGTTFGEVAFPVTFAYLVHRTLVLMCRPSKSASTGAGKSAARLFNAVLRPPRAAMACRLSRAANVCAVTGWPSAQTDLHSLIARVYRTVVRFGGAKLRRSRGRLRCAGPERRRWGWWLALAWSDDP